MIVTAIEAEHVEEKRRHAEDRGASGKDHGAQAADAGGDDGLRLRQAGLVLLGVDLLDEDNGVLDQHARQAEQPEKCREAEWQVCGQKSDGGAGDGHGHDGPDHGGLTQLAEQ